MTSRIQVQYRVDLIIGLQVEVKKSTQYGMRLDLGSTIQSVSGQVGVHQCGVGILVHIEEQAFLCSEVRIVRESDRSEGGAAWFEGEPRLCWL